MPSADVILPCMALGVSTFVMQASESVISVCFNSSLLKYGGDVAVGAMTILTSVMQFAMLPLQGIGQGAQPVTSYNYGAKNTDRVKKTFKILITVSLSYSVIFWALIQMFPSVFAGIFSSDKSLVTFTADALKIYCWNVIYVWNTDSVPDDICGNRQCNMLSYSRSCEKICTSSAAYLHSSKFCVK